MIVDKTVDEWMKYQYESVLNTDKFEKWMI